MKLRTKIGAAMAVAAFAMAGAASAATFIDTWTVNNVTGAISVVIGDTGLGIDGGSTDPIQGNSTHVYNATTGAFTDTFDFFLPTGSLGSSVTSSDTTNALVFTGVTFNGVSGMIGPTPAGLPSAGITAQLVTKGATQELILTGTGGAAASFGGTANFSPSSVSVPEPASWTLMIVGFGSAGALLRRRRRGLLATAA
jgi:hypothetical protein